MPECWHFALLSGHNLSAIQIGEIRSGSHVKAARLRSPVAAGWHVWHSEGSDAANSLPCVCLSHARTHAGTLWLYIFAKTHRQALGGWGGELEAGSWTRRTASLKCTKLAPWYQGKVSFRLFSRLVGPNHGRNTSNWLPAVESVCLFPLKLFLEAKVSPKTRLWMARPSTSCLKKQISCCFCNWLSRVWMSQFVCVCVF